MNSNSIPPPPPLPTSGNITKTKNTNLVVYLLEGSEWSVANCKVKLMKSYAINIPNKTLVDIDGELFIVVSEFDEQLKNNARVYGSDVAYNTVNEFKLPANSEVMIGDNHAIFPNIVTVRPRIKGIYRTPAKIFVKLPVGTKLHNYYKPENKKELKEEKVAIIQQ